MVTIALGLLSAQSAIALTATDLSSYQFTSLTYKGYPWPTPIINLAINNQGQIVGDAFHIHQGVFWDIPNGTFSALKLWYAGGINNAGQIVGGVGDNGRNPAISNPPYSTPIQYLNYSGYGTRVNAINDSGKAVGVDGKGAVVWDTNNNTVTKLNQATNTYHSGIGAQAYDINNTGLAVGYDVGFSNYARNTAALWNTQTNTETNLAALLPSVVYANSATGAKFQAGFGGSSEAKAINDSGLVVGDAYFIDNPASGGKRYAMLWDTANNTVTQLTGVSSNGEIYATTMVNDINNSGVIVGNTTLADARGRGLGVFATLWSNGNVYNLNDFLDPSLVAAGWLLAEARGINDNGWIVGTASNVSLGLYGTAFLLAPVTVPVPEPESYAMLMAGLGVLLILRRRQHLLH